MQQQKQKTQIDQRREAAATTMQQVMALLGWSLSRYTWHKYRTGLEYLRIYTGQDAAAIGWMEQQRTFWNWWKNHWALREEQFVISTTTMKDRHHREMLYQGINNPMALASEICPNGHVLGDSYAKMIGQMNDQLHEITPS